MTPDGDREIGSGFYFAANEHRCEAWPVGLCKNKGEGRALESEGTDRSWSLAPLCLRVSRDRASRESLIRFVIALG